MLLSSLLVLAVSPLIQALSVPLTTEAHDHDHSHIEHGQLPGTWYQPGEHSATKLFRRAPDDGVKRPDVGSPEWLAQFPIGKPDVTQLPKAWVDALNAAVAAGKIPNVVQAMAPGGNTNPVYPPGVNPASPEVCSTTYQCESADVIFDAPAGVFASSCDDGPQPAGTRLIQFLQANNVKTTHFMIGNNIRANPQLFLQTFNAGGDIAVHTYTHPYMTTLTNLEIVAELGWTMQIIHESTGGRVPRFWRPPYGDSDNRVRAIASEVFGLRTVKWRQDSADWGMAAGTTTPEGINKSLTDWITCPKSSGLCILEHEIADPTIDAFIRVFPLIAQNGWRFQSLAASFGGGVYQNAQSSTSDVRAASILDGAGGTGNNSTTTTTPATTTSTSTAPPNTTTVVVVSASPSAQSSPNKNNAGTAVQQSSVWTVSMTLIGLLAGSFL